MSWLILVPIVFGFSLPFMAPSAVRPGGFPRYVVRLVLFPGAFLVGLWLIDRFSGNHYARTYAPWLLAYAIAGLLGYGVVLLLRQRRTE
jgi:hypothetical protein